MGKFKRRFSTIVLLFAVISTYAQSTAGIQTDGSRQNNIITAVPFLLIVPQARVGAMGNAGAALNADANLIATNIAGLAFKPEKNGGISLSYSPWLKNLANDMSLTYLAGYYKVNERSALSGSFRFFSLGDVELTDVNFQNLGIYTPNELALDVSYIRNLGPDFALGATLRFIHSGLYNNGFSASEGIRAGQALAADVSGIYKKETTMFGLPTLWSLGLVLSNIGTKIKYSDNGRAYFLPANLKLGTAASINVDEESTFLFALDLNKLMAPTQPIYNTDGEIIKGKDPDRSVPAGIIGSFADAPGGFGEELKEIGLSAGIEYSFQQKFALRVGYNYQDEEKGNGRYLTLGAGLRYKAFNIDFAYIAANIKNSPLANTLRFTLQASLDKAINNN